MHIARLAPLALLAGSLLALCGCPKEKPQVFVELQNSSGAPIHLLGPGESFDPSNRLDPGAKRFFSVDEGTAAITIRAGSNGEVFTSEACEVPGGGLTDAQFLTVFYNNAGVLTCVLQ